MTPGFPGLALVASPVGLGRAVGFWLCWLNPLVGAVPEGWGHPRVLSPLGTALAGGSMGDLNPIVLCCLVGVNGNC